MPILCSTISHPASLAKPQDRSIQYGSRDIRAYLRSTRSSSLAVIQKGAVKRRFLAKRMVGPKKQGPTSAPHYARGAESSRIKTALPHSLQIIQRDDSVEAMDG